MQRVVWICKQGIETRLIVEVLVVLSDTCVSRRLKHAQMSKFSLFRIASEQ